MFVIPPFLVNNSSIISSNIIEELPLSTSGANFNSWNDTTSYGIGNQVSHVGPVWYYANPYRYDDDDEDQNNDTSGNTFNIWTAKYAGANLEPGVLRSGTTTLPGYWAWTLDKMYPVYSASAIYSKGMLIGYDSGATGAVYQSLIDNNIGNTPSSSPTQWKQTGSSYLTYSSGTTYAAEERSVVFYGTRGLLFESLQSGNTAHTPETSPTWWEYKGESFKTYDSTATYSIEDIVIDPLTHGEYESVVDSNVGQALTNTEKWLYRQTSNRWRMFDTINSAQSVFSDEIDIMVQVTGLVDTIALMNLSASSISIAAMAIEDEERNTLQYTEEFDNTYWTTSSDNISIVPNASIAPDGTMTMDRIIEDTSNGQHILLATGPVVNTGDVVTLSFFVKSGTRDQFKLFMSSSSSAEVGFDLSDLSTFGSAGSNGGNQPTDYGIEEVVDDIYRVWMTRTFNHVNDIGVSYIGLFFTVDQINSYVGDGSSYLDVWGAQFEFGSAATYYQKFDTAYSGTSLVYSYSAVLESYAGITDWYAYFFNPIIRPRDFLLDDLPLYSDMRIRVIVRDTDSLVRIGSLIFGKKQDIGLVSYGATVGIQDYSKKEIDTFGNFQVVKRNFSKNPKFKVACEPDMVDPIHDMLSDYRATPILYIGTEEYTSTWAFGYYKDFNIEISGPTLSWLNIEIESLT